MNRLPYLPTVYDRVASRKVAFPMPPRSFALGDWSSDDQDALDTLIQSSLPKIFGRDDWYIQGVGNQNNTVDDARTIVKAAMYYYGLGYALSDWKSFVDALAASLPQYNKLGLAAILSLLSGIDASQYPGDIALLKAGHADAGAESQQSSLARSAAVSNVVDEVEDKLSRGASAIGTAAKDAGSAVVGALPWYMKPQLLIPLALGGVGIFYLLQMKGAAKLIPWKKNPIEKKETKRSRARQVYKLWHDKNPTRTKKLPAIDTSELVELGDVVELGYSSKKWTGKKEYYKHEFDKGVKLMCTPDRKTLLLHGGKMEVQDIGIVH